MPYDAHRRRTMIDSLRHRDRFQPVLKASNNGNLIVFKVEFGLHLKSLEIRKGVEDYIVAFDIYMGKLFFKMSVQS